MSWNLVGAVVTNVLRVVTVVVLGRLLEPSEFGIVAAALSVTIILHAIRDIGIGPALVQRRDLTEQHLSTAFAVQLYFGLVLSSGLAVLAPVIGNVYGITESIGVLRALAAIFALRGIAAVSSAMCQRAMNFRAVALIDMVAYGSGTITSLLLAATGAGAWSLVIGYLVEELVSMVSYVAMYSPPWSLKISKPHLKELLDFGTSQSVIQVAGVLATYSDNIIVGNALGKVYLGYYTRAYDLIKLPAAVFSTVIGSVLFPAFSKLQDDKERLAEGFRKVVFANSVVLFPASALLIVAAPEVIRIVMGGQWAEAVPPFQILAVTMMFRTTYKVGAMVASAAGSVRDVAVANVLYMIIVIVGALIGVEYGIVGVAITTAFALTVVYVHCTALAVKVSGLAWAALVRAHLPGIAIAVLVFIVSSAIVATLRPSMNQWTIVVTTLVSSALITLAALGLAQRRSDDARWFVAELMRFVRRRVRH